ncbi:HPF/RaiA family ribosome-associated protein, partial [Candidatus Parcubacteria bacterium]|nr:HPF/RaiA family ribosome-associated protein [Candidatus Parcubacteria bacterium]
MRINIKATGIELTPAITDYAERKVAMLDKYIARGTDAVAQIEVGKSTRHHKSGD